MHRSLERVLWLTAKIVENPDEELLKDFARTISETDQRIIKMIEDKILGSFFKILRNPNSRPGLLTKTLECLILMLAEVKVDKVEAFYSLCVLTSRRIFDPENVEVIKGLPEELKEAAMNALKAYVEYTKENILPDLYNCNEIQRAQLGMVLLLVSKIFLCEKSISLRVSALEALMALLQTSSNDEALTKKVANVFIYYLPGLVAPLMEIIITEHTTNHKVVMLSVRAWGRLIGYCLQDIPGKDDDEDETWNWKPEDYIMWLSSQKNPIRTNKWARAAAVSLTDMFKKMARKTHPHVNVRLEMASAFGFILQRCNKNLKSHGGPLLDALVCLTRDEDKSVRVRVSNIITNLRRKDNFPLKILAQERMSEILTGISLRSDDSAAFQQSLQILSGYMLIFEDEGPCIVTNPLFLQRLLPVLKAASRIELNNEILHEHDLEPHDFKRYEIKRRKTSINFNKICESIAKYNFEAATFLLMSQDGSKLESLAVLNLLVKYLKDPKSHLVDDIEQFYLAQNSVTILEDPTPREMEELVMKIVLSMQGLKALATALGEEFSNHLLRTLYSVIERIGSRYSVIREAALEAAEAMAKVCGCENVPALIESNLDYLTNHIILRLRRLSEEDVLDAVRIVTRLCPGKTLPQLQHIVAQILSSSNVDFNSPQVGPYLRVFQAFVDCAAAAYPLPEVEKDDQLQNSHGERLAAFIRKIELEELDEMDLEDDTPTETSDDDDDEKPKLPTYVDICIKTVGRCLHYLPACSDMQKIKCLEILNVGIQVIAPYENELLPLVHQIWSPLVRRFQPTAKPLIISRSFSLLVTMCHLAKDFIRMRTLKEVLPALRDYLEKSAKISLHQSVKSAFSTTQGYKLQCQLLLGLGSLTTDLRLRERDTSQIAEAATLYLNKSQPKPLQEAAVNMYKTLLHYDPCFISYRLEPMCKMPEYLENIKKILQ